MKLQFGYNWKELKVLLYVVPIALAIGAYREGGFTWPSTVVMLVIFAGMAIWRAWPISCVSISESDVKVSYLVPLRRSVTYPHDAIEGYAELAPSFRGKKMFVGGILVPKSDKRLTIFASGTKNFEDLNSALSHLFPNTLRAEQDDGDQTPPAVVD